MVDPYESVRDRTIRAGVVFIDEPDVVRAIRAVAPHAHIVILPSAVIDGRSVARTQRAPRARPNTAGEALTRREHTVLAHVATGETNAEIADALGLAPNTIKAYLQSVLRKLGARNRVEALAYARSYGIV